jgi:formamidopyrimidine-DNA glycosylase
MPELPEVETVVRGLRPRLVGRTFTAVDSGAAPVASIVVSPSLPGRSLEELLPGRTVRGVERRGKNILIGLSGELTLWVHLKMTGQFRSVPPDEPRGRHDLVTFDLGPGCHLRFHDFRRFGRLRLYPDAELWRQPGLADLGPEPLEITSEAFADLCSPCRRMIKPALMDQTFIAGIGNIYADEALFLSRIHPARRTHTIARRKLVELHDHHRSLMIRSIDLAGTTIINFTSVEGEGGAFQRLLQVYGRTGEPCTRCGHPIRRIVIGSRSSHLCTYCQRRR